jgi:hypothetical protein
MSNRALKEMLSKDSAQPFGPFRRNPCLSNARNQGIRNNFRSEESEKGHSTRHVLVKNETRLPQRLHFHVLLQSKARIRASRSSHCSAATGAIITLPLPVRQEKGTQLGNN